MKYELEKVIVTGDEWENNRREEFIAASDSKAELLERTKTIPLKGGRYLHEHLAITEHDEYGDIVDFEEIYADERKRLTSKRQIAIARILDEEAEG